MFDDFVCTVSQRQAPRNALKMLLLLSPMVSYYLRITGGGKKYVIEASTEWTDNQRFMQGRGYGLLGYTQTKAHPMLCGD